MTFILLTAILAILIIWLFISLYRVQRTKFAAVESTPEAAAAAADSGEPVALPLAGEGQKGMPTVPVPETRGILAQYGISYAKRIYVDELFSLQVHLAEENASLTVKKGDKVVAAGELGFIHEWYKQINAQEPLPKIKVDLIFADGDFQASSKSQTKEMALDNENIFTFQVKPLKSTDLFLQVQISYLGVRWQPEKTVEITVADDGSKRTTTVRKTPGGFMPNPQILVSEELVIQVKSFMNLNAADLAAASKIAAALLTLIYAAIVILGGMTDSVSGTIIVAITTLAGIFGIPIADVLTTAKIKNEEASSGT